jgi:hypothetical protein
MLAGALIASQGLAQNDQNAATEYLEREVDEIVVYGSQQLDPYFANQRYQEILREQRLQQMEIMRLEEEADWRATLTYPLSTDPRITLGYDPKLDSERQPDLVLVRGPGDTVQPATVIRVGFNWP